MTSIYFCAALLSLLIGAHGFYIPGAYPREFRVGDTLAVHVNSLSSFDTEMPFDYYSLPFCEPAGGPKPVREAANAGTLLQGLRIETSPYEFTMKVKQTTEIVCKPESASKELTAEDVTHKIDNHYRINMILDNLPITTYDLLDENEEFVRPGFELGFQSDGKYYIYNHLVFNVLVYLTHGEYTAAEAMTQGLTSNALNRKVGNWLVLVYLTHGQYTAAEAMTQGLTSNALNRKVGNWLVLVYLTHGQYTAAEAMTQGLTSNALNRKVGNWLVLVYLTHGQYTAAEAMTQGLTSNALNRKVGNWLVLVYLTHGQYSAAEAMTQGLASNALNRKVGNWLVLVYLTHGQCSAAEAMAQSLSSNSLNRKVLEVNSNGVRELQASDEASPEAFYMVVGFEVAPCSITRPQGKVVETVMCGVDGDSHIEPQEILEGHSITYTYDVHWFGIVNSLIVVLLMAVLVATILIRTIHRDLIKYEQLLVDTSLETKEEAGWKLISGDAFRPPAQSKTLAVQLGSGVQIMTTTLVTLILASLGFLSPSARGALMTTALALYILLALVAGFSATYLWGIMERTYNGWPQVCFSVSLYFPGIIMLVITVLNLALHLTGSSGAIPIACYIML
eukprot:gene31786-6982_t